MTLKDRLIHIFILSLIGLALGAAIAGISLFMDDNRKDDSFGSQLVAPSIGGPFTLLNQDGKTVTDKDFSGKYLFIYFGFTYCPAICPTELQKMTEVIHTLPKEWQSRIQPLFISIDPERDTPKVLKDYVGLFMPNLIGLTGSTEQIEAVKRAYKVYGAKVVDGDTYTMDHSSFIYFMGLNGQALAMFKANDTAETIAKKITQLDGLD